MRSMLRVVSLSFVLASAFVPPARAQIVAADAGTEPRIEVTGRGESRVSPDGASVTFSVETKGASAAVAAASSARIQTRVVDTLRNRRSASRDARGYSSVEGTPISPSEIVISELIVAKWRFTPGP